MVRKPTRARRTTDPSVILDLACERGMFLFVLSHRGDTPVRDISVKFRRKIVGMGGDLDISGLPIWTNLTFLPPGKEIRVPIDIAATFLARDKGKPLTVVVSYTEGDQDDRWMAEITHDFTAYRDMPEVM